MNGFKPLSFADYLAQLPSAMVFDHFGASAGQNRRILSASMIQELASSFSSPENLASIFSALSPDAQLLCAFAYLFGNGGIPLAHQQATPAPGNDELIKSFLVYAAYDETGNVRYVPFADFEPGLRTLCAQTVCKQASVPMLHTASGLSRQSILNDITVITALASYEKLKVTKSGTLNKNSEAFLAKILHCTQPPYYSAGKNNILLDLCIDYARFLSLLVLRKDTLHINHKAVQLWLMEPTAKKLEGFFAYVCTVFPLWNTELLSQLLSCAKNSGIATHTFPEHLRHEAVSMVKILAYFGFIDFYKSGSGYVICRLAHNQPAGDEPVALSKIIIMPDFTALIPQEIQANQLYWFSCVGVFLSLDHVYKGVIDKETVNNSLSNGIEKSQILSWLQNLQCPHNVLETIKEWIREFSRLSFETTAYIVCSEEKITRQLASYAPLHSVIAPLEAHTIFKVRPGHEHEVQSILSGLGFDIRPDTSYEHFDGLVSDAQTEDSNNAVKLVQTHALEPIVDFTAPDTVASAHIKQGKYSSELKELDCNNLIHVVDYAILMGYELHFEYAGSPGVKKGIHKIVPTHFKKGASPVLDGESITTHTTKTFLLEKITKIGVKSNND